MISLHYNRVWYGSAIAFILLLSGLPELAIGQSGTPYITDYLNNRDFDNRISSIGQHGDETMIFATRRGILSFDGAKWNLNKTTKKPRRVLCSAAMPAPLILFADEFGFLEKSEKGEFVYQQAFESSRPQISFSEVSASGSNLFLYSPQQILKVDPADPCRSMEWGCISESDYDGFLPFGDRVFVNLYGDGIFELTRNGRTRVCDNPGICKIQFCIPFDARQTLIGTNDNRLFLFDGTRLCDYSPQAMEYIEQSTLIGGLDLGPEKYALSTATGGCIIIDKRTGQTEITLNYQNGLPDDEIFGMGTDRTGGLWISHEFGVSRCDLGLPVRDYNTYPGLIGNLLAVATLGQELYVATSEGVFYLAETKDFDEVEVLIKASPVSEKMKTEMAQHAIDEAPVSLPPPPVYYEEDAGPSKKEEREARKESKRELRQQRREERKARRQNRRGPSTETDLTTDNLNAVSEETGSTTLEPTPEHQPADPAPAYSSPNRTISKQEYCSPTTSTLIEIVRSRKIYAMQSISHHFRRVAGLFQKVRQLERFDDQLLVAAQNGLYFIKGMEAKPIISNVYVNLIRKAPGEGRYFIGTASGLMGIRFEDGAWKIESRFPNIRANIVSIYSENDSIVWLGAENLAYQLNLNRPGEVRPDFFDHDYFEPIFVTRFFDRVCLFHGDKLYWADPRSGDYRTSKRFENLLTDNAQFYFQQEGYARIFTKNRWIGTSESPEIQQINREYLPLFESVENIFVDDNGDTWVIDGKNGLSRIRCGTSTGGHSSFVAYLRGVRNEMGKLFSLDDIRSKSGEAAIEINIAAPFYIKTEGTRYQYYIDGLMGNWSNWSHDPTISLPYLPAGDHQILFRAQNVHGHLSETNSLKIHGIPKFWMTWWFFFGCIFITLSAGYVGMRLREKNLKRLSALLEEKIQIRTEQLRIEKKKATDLLLNILPKRTAEELQNHGAAITRTHEDVSVMFTDFENFSAISRQFSPKKLLSELHWYFTMFDQVTTKYRIEKIKTIGDSYMCASGVPVEDPNHAVYSTLAGLEIIHNLRAMQCGKDQNDPLWNIRVGIHTGPVIAGVVGKKKFAFDIWGDAVNTASRMESAGQVGVVNISAALHARIEPWFEFKSRGKVKIKDGSTMQMFLVKRIRPEWSADAEGKLPNQAMLNEIARLTGTEPISEIINPACAGCPASKDIKTCWQNVRKEIRTANGLAQPTEHQGRKFCHQFAKEMHEDISKMNA